VANLRYLYRVTTSLALAPHEHIQIGKAFTLAHLRQIRIDHLYVDPHFKTNFFLHYADLIDSNSIFKIISEIKPDEIYNLGAQSHVGVSFENPEYTAQVTGLGTLRILEAMRFLNYLGNHFFSWVFTWLLDQRFKDTLCGTKVMFRKDYIKLTKNRTYFGEFDPFGDFDLLFGAHKLNLKIVEIPIKYRDRTYGETNISRFKHGIILLRMCAFASRKCKFI
jgi:hypothetical protein